jgi:hypothetical protein
MTFLAPLAAVFGLIVPAIVALYFLKPRRPEIPVPSTLLWQRATRETRAAVPWQRLRVSWLLALQLIAAALIVAALVRPAVSGGSGLSGTNVAIVDASETMQATDVHPNRFAVAKSRAAALIDRVGESGRLELVAMDAHPRILASPTSDRAVLHRALAALQVSSEPADLQDALELAAAVAGPGRQVRAVVLSDGITEPVSSTMLLPFPVDYQPIGVSGENAAITALTVLPGPGSGAAVAHVQNFGHQSREVTVSLSADGRVVDARTVGLPAGTSEDVGLSFPARADHVTATLVPHDILSVDDTTIAIARPARVSRVVVVTDGNLFLLRALSLRRDLIVTSVTPAQYRKEAGVGMYVFDRFRPPVPPGVPYLLIDPPGEGAGLAPGRLYPAEAGDALLADVDLSDVHVARAEDLRNVRFGRPVIDSATGVVLEVQDTPVRAGLLGFDLHESDLPLRAAFPVLVTNLSAFLDPPAVPPGPVTPGSPVEIAAGARSSSVSVTRPDGQAETLPVGSGQTFVVDPDTSEAGLYRVTIRAMGHPPVFDEFAVNAGRAPGTASDVAPLEHMTVAGTASVVAAGSAPTRRDLWLWIALAGIVVLLAEWVVYLRVT